MRFVAEDQNLSFEFKNFRSNLTKKMLSDHILGYGTLIFVVFRNTHDIGELFIRHTER